MSKPGGDPSSGISSEDVMIPTERHPACRQREARPGSTLERWLGVSDRLVRDLARRGIVVRAGRNLYKLEESVRNVVEDMRKQLGRRGGPGVAAEAAAERARLARVQADLAE